MRAIGIFPQAFLGFKKLVPGREAVAEVLGILNFV